MCKIFGERVCNLFCFCVECDSVVVCECWSDHVLYSRVCMCCVCDPNVSVAVYFVCVCMSVVISVFSAVSEGSYLFGLLVLFLCCIFVVIYSGTSLHVVDILHFGMLVEGDV